MRQAAGLGQVYLRDGQAGGGGAMPPTLPDAERVDRGIERAMAELLGRQQPDGHWVFELEADATLPAEYILLGHYLAEPAVEHEARIGAYLRARQTADGGWPLFHGGEFNLSSTVKAYFALKAIGDDPLAPHMEAARQAVLAHGGAARANVFTRILLALFGEVPWRAVPAMPVEIMNLPRWFPFHLDKISYWSRTCLVPLLVLMALKPRARNPRDVHIRELFTVPPELERDWLRPPTDTWLATAFIALDAVVRRAEPHFSRRARKRAIEKATAFVLERLNGQDGLGGIYPAMAYSAIMFDALGWPADVPELKTIRRAIELLVVEDEHETYCQPCLSPIWDTALACQALIEVGDAPARQAAEGGLKWLADRQVLDVKGDWAVRRPQLEPGGWAFQYANPHYPDVDDTAVVVMAMARQDPARFAMPIERATAWVMGMQSRNGGWGAFDADNTHDYLNHIPFADHGALLDPPTADVTARCLGMLVQLGQPDHASAIEAALDYLRREQEADGSWFGRWGTNYIYGTWSVLVALDAAGVPHDAPEMSRAIDWLVAKQRPDGGWGEDGRSYWTDQPRGEGGLSTPSQTSWALLALMAAGQARSEAVARGIRFLLAHQAADGGWHEEEFTAVGFPRVFYLRYHGYPRFFPLWALARYRNLTRSNAPLPRSGM